MLQVELLPLLGWPADSLNLKISSYSKQDEWTGYGMCKLKNDRLSMYMYNMPCYGALCRNSFFFSRYLYFFFPLGELYEYIKGAYIVRRENLQLWEYIDIPFHVTYSSS